MNVSVWRKSALVRITDSSWTLRHVKCAKTGSRNDNVGSAERCFNQTVNSRSVFKI
jgi:hypothetical protein